MDDEVTKGEDDLDPSLQTSFSLCLLWDQAMEQQAPSLAALSLEDSRYFACTKAGKLPLC